MTASLYVECATLLVVSLLLRAWRHPTILLVLWALTTP